MTDAKIDGYVDYNPESDPAHDFLLPQVIKYLGKPGPDRRLFDLGCGDGTVGARLAALGWQVSGVDPSRAGIDYARASYPQLDLHLGSAYDDLHARFGSFAQVISLEVVEHVYAPRDYARTLFELVAPGGHAILSTPYHGYLKNLALAVTGTMDRHFTALWDHGHIKFWSIETLSKLLIEAGFVDLDFARVGRIPAVAKCMVVKARRPL